MGHVRFTILSGKADAFSVARLRAAFEERGHETKVVSPFDCCISFDHRESVVLHRGRPVVADAVIPRMSSRSATPFALAVLRQLETSGACVLNRANAIDLARDKLRSLQALAGAGVPVPLSFLLSRRSQVRRAIDRVGTPAIVKLARGTHGVGVMLADGEESLRTLLATLFDLSTDSVVQRFHAECRGRDLRAFVVGDRVVAAMRRTARKGEFRANLHRGARGDRAVLDRTTRSIVLRAVRTVGLEVAGVDLLEANDGTLVLEVNSSPSLEGIERVTGEDVGCEITIHAERLVRRHRRRS